jgi:hypothetical protein
MTTWAETKHRAIQAFNGELPKATTEQTIIDAFELEPVAVLHQLDSVIDDYNARKCRSGWATLKFRVATLTVTADITVDTDNRPKQIRLAEQWIRNVGGYIDRPDELEAALFGDTGRLRHWADDPILQQRMAALWREVRHRFVKTELDAHQRQAEQAATLKRIRRHTSTAGLGWQEAEAHANRIAAEIARAREAQERLAYYDTLEPAGVLDDPAQP